MTSQKLKSPGLTTGQLPKKVGEPKIIPAILGKKIVFITDDRDISVEMIVTPFVLSAVGAHQSSGSEPYSKFFPDPPQADLLILRSSRLFSHNPDRLISALEKFREANQHASVIVCAFDGIVFTKLEPLKENGVINHLVSNPPSDLDLIRLGAGLFQESRSF